MKRFAILLSLAVVNLLLVLWLSQPRMLAHAQVGAAPFSPVSLPWQFDGKVDAARLRLEVSGAALSGAWRIVPDDELLAVMINGKPVSLTHLPPHALRDWSRGFDLDLDLQSGRNVVELQVRNEGGSGGVQVHLYPSWYSLILLGVSGVLAILALHALLPLSIGQRFILLLALIPLLSYWSGTPWTVRSHDVGGLDGHFGYVAWVADHLALPRPDAGWTFYHPPFYYIAGAMVARLADVFGIDRAVLLQMFSLALWLVFLVASSATLRRLLRGRGQGLLIATAALAFWPSGIIHSIRIGNDAAVYASSALLAYCLVLWWKTASRRALIGMGVFTVLALCAKTSSIAVVGSACLLAGARVLFSGRAGLLAALWPALWLACCAALGLGLSLARNLYHYLRGELSGWLVGNEGGLSSALRVPVDLKSFIPLDIPTFLTTPWINPWDDASGRGNFWNYLLRSSLTGEFHFDGIWLKLLSFLMGVALLLLCLLILKHTLAVIVRWRFITLYRQLPLYLLGSLWVASLIALRIKTPYSCSNDFRYIVPVLLPFLIFAVQSGLLARWMLGLMAMASFGFFMAI